MASVSRQSGGLFEACRRLAQTLAKTNDLKVVGVQDSFTDTDLPAWEPLRPVTLPSVLGDTFGFAFGYADAVRRISPDLVHVHALWIYPSLAGYQWHRRTNKPLVYSAHGMLDSWAIQHSGWKKRLVRTLWEDAAHRRAACFYAISEGEYRSMREFGLRNPICVIPNGVDLPVELTPLPAPRCVSASRPETLLYLGRLHPKKNLGSLVRAWALVQKEGGSARGWQLAIAGWDQGGYERTLRKQAAHLALEDSVVFTGPAFGDDKAAAHRNASAFVLPSLSEGLPMVVLEAWAYGRPVLMTRECNLPEGFREAAALEIGTSVDAIATGLRSMFDMSENERTEMGRRGRQLVQERFLWSAIGEQVRAVYAWILGGGTPPATVRLD